MFRAIVRLLKKDNLLVQSHKLLLEMLKDDLGMFEDSIKCLWKDEGVSIEEIRKRDREINHHVREVRIKILTHLVFSGSVGLETSLVILNIVRDIERIGDHTKDITYLADHYTVKFNPGGFEQELKDFERILKERIAMLVEILDSAESEKARKMARTHKDVDKKYQGMIDRLISEEETDLTKGQSVMLALYLRYLRRIEGHVYNIVSAEVNPFHRVGFKMKKKQDSAEIKDTSSE
jgi:phosphate uptake regulator